MGCIAYEATAAFKAKIRAVISQIGGQYVSVAAIMSDPSTDPHTYEASTTDAGLIDQATLVGWP